jgi:hypothetical protein
VPQSLRRTWALLGLASLAVLFVAFLAGRDFVRDVFPECPASLEPDQPYNGKSRQLEPVVLESSSPPSDSPAFQLLFDEKRDPRVGSGWGVQYSNVRIVWNDYARDGSRCQCGSIPVQLSGESPHDLRLYRGSATNLFVVKGRVIGTTTQYESLDTDVRTVFTLKHGTARRLQWNRVVTMRQLPSLVVLFAIGALVVALVRSRRAMAYALHLHTWTEARLVPGGLIESEDGRTLGTLEHVRITARGVRPGAILIAPEALSTASLYRDVPIIPRGRIAEGSHARWANGTMLRLRDARALAIISTACAVLAFGARVIA